MFLPTTILRAFSFLGYFAKDFIIYFGQMLRLDGREEREAHKIKINQQNG